MNFLQTLQYHLVELIGKVHWRQRDPLPTSIRTELAALLKLDYYIIATRRGNQLSTFFISLGHFLLTGKWGFFSHVLMNLENEVNSMDDYRLIEATGDGTHYSTFEEAFHEVDSVALIKPASLTIEQWTAAMDTARAQLGKPYDTLFDIKNDQALSCVELIRVALMGLPTYSTDFAHFEKTIVRARQLTPQMILDCPDFEVVWKKIKS